METNDEIENEKLKNLKKLDEILNKTNSLFNNKETINKINNIHEINENSSEEDILLKEHWYKFVKSLLEIDGLEHLLIHEENIYHQVILLGKYRYDANQIRQAIEYFEKKEDYKKCSQLQNVLENLYLKNLGS